MSTVLTAATCTLLTCVVIGAHTHPECPVCGAFRYGNLCCATCRELRGGDCNPHTLVRAAGAVGSDG